MQQFELDPRLKADTIAIADLPLSTVRLMLDGNFPWIVLVPRRPGLVEIVDLAAEERMQLMAEIATASEALRATVRCDKLNVGAIGNMVRQLHVHVIARRIGDVTWPKPVWGQATAQPYPPGEAEALAAALAARLR